MIIEYIYSNSELRTKKCFECKWFEMIDDWNGVCKCPHNKIKFRNRQITDRKCVWKNADTHTLKPTFKSK